MDVLIVSPDAVLRRWLADMLAETPGTRTVGQVVPDDALESIAGHPALQAVVWALTWDDPSPAGLRAVARTGVPLICLVSSPDEARQARAAGASAVLSRAGDSDGLEAALRAVASGLVVLDPQVDPDWRGGSPAADPPLEPLTPREMEVLALVAEGLSNKAVAVRLGIRESTVKDHVNALMGKLEAQSRTEAVIVALRRGLLSV